MFLLCTFFAFEFCVNWSEMKRIVQFFLLHKRHAKNASEKHTIFYVLQLDTWCRRCFWYVLCAMCWFFSLAWSVAVLFFHFNNYAICIRWQLLFVFIPRNLYVHIDFGRANEREIRCHFYHANRRDDGVLTTKQRKTKKRWHDTNCGPWNNTTITNSWSSTKSISCAQLAKWKTIKVLTIATV